MKLIHTGDLHIGKIVNEFSMLKDQADVLKKIVRIAVEEEADGIIIAGDIYDRSVPPAEAVTLMDWFLTELIKHGLKVFMISGNHDSPERIAFASDIMDAQGVYIAGTYEGSVKSVSLTEGDLSVNLYLLPFVKPQVVKYYEEILQDQNLVELRENIEGNKNAKDKDDIETGEVEIEFGVEAELETESENEVKSEGNVQIKTFEDGVRCALDKIELDPSACNILVTHHFVTAGGQQPELSDSESGISLGGIDNVDVSVFDGFDYVALGHIHRAQRIGRDTIRYAGTPLKYSFSECQHKKSVTIVEIKPDKSIELRTRELVPLHDRRKIKGELKDLMNPEYVKRADQEDYIQATLTDEVELVDPIGTLRSVYPNICQIILAKNLKETEMIAGDYQLQKRKNPMELFEEFFEKVTGRQMDEKRKSIVEEVISQTMGGAEDETNQIRD